MAEPDLPSEIHGRIYNFLVDELDVTEVDANRIADRGADAVVEAYHEMGYV